MRSIIQETNMPHASKKPSKAIRKNPPARHLRPGRTESSAAGAEDQPQ